MKKVNIAMLGTGFMGKAHSNGWMKVAKFFDLPYEPVLKVAFGTDKEDTEAFAKCWGYEQTAYDWREVIAREDIDIVDIVAPTKLHSEMVIAAAQAGKAIFCEKPAALSYGEAEAMAKAAKSAGVLNYLNHNYRRVPAVSFAKKMIEEGRLGRIYQWRGAYLQDWIMDPEFPLTWHFKKELAAGGPLWDLSSHAVDTARYLVGEIDKVTAVQKTFITERPLPGKGAATFAAGAKNSGEMGRVEVDDASCMIVEFENGVLGNIDSSRFAGGRKNYNYFEIYGSKGSLIWNFERMNELQYNNLEDSEDEQGFRTIMVTNPGHPYSGNWWPPGHVIGYEHAFVNAMADFLNAMKHEVQITPNMADGANIIRVLEAARLSDEQERKVSVSEIK